MGWVSRKALVRPAGLVGLSGDRGQAGIGRGRAEEQGGDEDAVRGTERQESKKVENKERDEEKAKASQPNPHNLACTCLFGGFGGFFGVVATSDLIPVPFNVRLLPN